jgi:hypothetical protein
MKKIILVLVKIFFAINSWGQCEVKTIELNEDYFISTMAELFYTNPDDDLDKGLIIVYIFVNAYKEKSGKIIFNELTVNYAHRGIQPFFTPGKIDIKLAKGKTISKVAKEKSTNTLSPEDKQQ